MTMGETVLAHLYREMYESTRPTRANMTGCLHLLHIWSWEHIHVGRPTLHVSYPTDLDGLNIGLRWNEKYVRQQPMTNVAVYRNELDGLLHTQVIWEPYAKQITERRRDYLVEGLDEDVDRMSAINQHMCWFRSWASIYLVAAPTDPLTTYYARAPIERIYAEHIYVTRDIFEPYFGCVDEHELQRAVDRYEVLCRDLRLCVYVGDTHYRLKPTEGVPHHDWSAGPSSYADPGSSMYADPGHSTYQLTYESQPSIFPSQDDPTQTAEDLALEGHHQLRDCPSCAPDQYTPESGAIPCRRQRC